MTKENTLQFNTVFLRDIQELDSSIVLTLLSYGIRTLEDLVKIPLEQLSGFCGLRNQDLLLLHSIQLQPGQYAQKSLLRISNQRQNFQKLLSQPVAFLFLSKEIVDLLHSCGISDVNDLFLKPWVLYQNKQFTPAQVQEILSSIDCPCLSMNTENITEQQFDFSDVPFPALAQLEGSDLVSTQKKETPEKKGRSALYATLSDAEKAAIPKRKRGRPRKVPETEISSNVKITRIDSVADQLKDAELMNNEFSNGSHLTLRAASAFIQRTSGLSRNRPKRKTRLRSSTAWI